MGLLVAIGFEIVIGVIIGLALFLIGLFVGHIDIFESIAVGIAFGFIAHGLLHWHPILSVLAGIAILLLMMFLINTSVGFWIIGGVMSVAWGFIGALIGYNASGGSEFWGYMGLAIGTLIIMALHFKARNKMDF